MAYILVSGGELIKASMNHDFTVDVAEMFERSIDEELEEAGYDPEDVSDEKRAEFAISAGYNSDHTYADEVDVDPDGDYEEAEYVTREGDSFMYSTIQFMLRSDEYDEFGEPIDDDWFEEGPDDEDYLEDEEDDYDYGEDWD